MEGEQTSSHDSVNVEENTVEVTNTMKEEERLLQDKTEQEQQIQREKARSEYDELVERQRYNRLKFLLDKTTLYSNFLTKKLEDQQQQQRDKAQRQEEKRKTQEERQVNAAATATTRVATRSGVTPSAPVASKRSQAQSQSRKHDDQYNLADYLTSEDVNKRQKTEDNHASSSKSKAKSTPAAVDVVPPPTAATFKPEDISDRQPKLVSGGVLRDYQLEGVEWLVSLYENGLNGILADEMGLGKTLQCISFLAYLRERGVHGPFVVVAPLSTVANWVSEFKRFAPAIPVLLYHGTIDERAKLRAKRMVQHRNDSVTDQFPVIVTSYEIIMNDRKYLQRYRWKYIIVDEGHRIKNLNCKLIRELKSYHSANRLLLTGTPLQNNLAELWSLLNFLLPDIFDDLESFQSWFDFSDVHEQDADNKIIEKEEKSQIVSKLHHILKPFLLRRLKCDVEKDLPKKREYLVFAPLTTSQREYYDAIINRDIRTFLLKKDIEVVPESIDLTETVDEDLMEITPRRQLRQKEKINYKLPSQIPESKVERHVPEEERRVNNMKLQNMMMQLRKACNHPYLFDFPVGDDGLELRIDEDVVRKSGKMLLLDRLLTTLLDRGHKVLIFSQMTTMLDILGDYLTMRSITYCRIDGSVPYATRAQQISDFNTTDKVKIFLLSTRSGGLGINLTSADTCIIYDSDWNPQMDLQAQDRVHRIGQTRPVIVYRLCTANTVESYILDKAGAKRRLEKLVIHKGKFKQTLGETQLQLSELQEILQSHDNQKVNAGDSKEVIDDNDLEMILDRSPSAFSNFETQQGSSFKIIEEQRSESNDALAMLS